MPLSQADRITFSGQIAAEVATIASLNLAAAAVQDAMVKAQALDDANKRLSDPTQNYILGYQAELGNLDGQVRSIFTEQDIKDASNKKLGNFFFPNNGNLTIPSLTSSHNVWTQVKPFALAYGLGKNYDESYTAGTSEAQLLIDALALITSASAYTDIQNTSGQSCGASGTCSLPIYLTQVDCLAHSGIWTPGPDVIADKAEIHTLLTNLAAKISAISAQLTVELGNIVSTDSDPTNSAQNTAATNNINSVILPALNAWLAYSDFNTAHGQTTCAGFNSYDPNLLAPTKLHSAQLSALQTALTNRQTFVTTREGQLNTILGTISQDVTTGITTGSGLFFRRFEFLDLRINVLNGSLTQLSSLQAGANAQATIRESTISQNNLYNSLVPTSTMQQSASDTAQLVLNSPAAFAQGDTVYVIADDQVELTRAVKSVNGSVVILNDIVPSKYRIESNLRIYKDVT